MTRHVCTCRKKPLRRKNQWINNQPITTKNQRVKNQAQKKGRNQWKKLQSENHWGETNRLLGWTKTIGQKKEKTVDNQPAHYYKKPAGKKPGTKKGQNQRTKIQSENHWLCNCCSPFLFYIFFCLTTEYFVAEEVAIFFFA